MITLDDFKNIDLRVARIIEAERVPDSQKLLRLHIDLGEEKRQIVSGIAEHYTPEELLGKQIVIVANLEPKMLMGVESYGMLLAVRDGETISLIIPEKDITPGKRIS